ncbi:hypothetical protein IA57_03145 [Mangrovimonas yunxiaonensis]|uniref:Nicotinate-nucleotide adenylyltransferase n=1 Tax=Mangrovimonas yunxiaonensis TaxID=1197477 RepID=A0A084TME8_9FLAO|nr:hypothetical protein [Mangrovimonas yunxiaonensis]KFB01884.1 hypothetical protein IA57_03145 [Mangrovimonas yunxiaonensis]GGH44472.1 hypothetical protein GCM10011364_17310 [Mangrovimonas yunxiaonensis]
MKKLCIGLLFFGLTSQVPAQVEEPVEDFYGVQLTEVNLKPINASYFDNVYDRNSPNDVKELQREVANYDIKESDVFDSQMESYDVLFKEKGGDKSRIIATFDKEGKILTSFERHNNIFLPSAVRNAIFKEYDGWTLAKTTYKVSYFQNKKVEKTYFARIEKDGRRKNLKIDAAGILH